MKDNKIAVFFDCENISSRYVDEIIDELAKVGEVIIKKAYHNWRENSSTHWDDKLKEFAIDAIQVFPNITGKNAADSKLIIDVMNIIYQSGINTICIVSSDSDFTVLASEIKSKGITSIGFGEKKTPESLRKAYTTFYELPVKKKIKNKAISLLLEAINDTKNEDDYVNISSVTNYLSNKDSSFIPQNYGYKKWSDLIKEETSYFIYEYRNNNRILMVKEKSD